MSITMIEMIKGDLFQSKHPIIAHGVNCQGVMGAGVALQIRKRYPEVYRHYKAMCEDAAGMDAFNEYSTTAQTNLLGKAQIIEENGDKIVNCFTQWTIGVGRQVSYDAIATSLTKTHDFAYQYDCLYVAMPMIGAGLGGGKWEVISAIIDTTFTKIPAKVYYL